nr:acrosomal protein KIAA1210 homolog [Camelus dromedarius]
MEKLEERSGREIRRQRREGWKQGAEFGDLTMAESLSEVSGSVEVLEASDEGKKKSKFKALKSFFGKKKKKEPEEAQGERRLQPSLSSSNINISSLKPIQEDQQSKPRAKSSMRIKALSHDSIFTLEPEPKRSASKTYPSPDVQRGRPLQRSHGFRTLPRAGTGSMHGAVFGAVPRNVPKSTEIPPLRPRQASNSPPLIRSDTISKDSEESSADEESPKSPRKKVSSYKVMTLKKRSFRPSPGPVHSQSLNTIARLPSSSSTRVPVGFSTPANTQGCLDSSAARHKMALNPRKQKKKSFQVKPKQEESSLPLVSEEEKSTTRPKEADQRRPKRDSAGPSSQKQSNRAEIYEKKTTDQAANKDAAGSQSYQLSPVYGRRRGRRGLSTLGTNERGSRRRSFKQSSRALGLGDRAGSPPADKTSRDSPFWHLPLEKQVVEQRTTPQTESAAPLELFSDKNDVGSRNAGVDFDARKASASQSIPEDLQESMVTGLSPYHEDGAAGAKKTEARAALSPVVENLSTTQDVIFSVPVKDQVFMDPSDIQSEEEGASSFDRKSVRFKVKSAQNPCREKPPGNVLQAFTASVSGTVSALADRGSSAEGKPPRSFSRSLGKPRPEAVASGSESTSEAGSGAEQRRARGYSSQPSGKSKKGQEVSPESESSAVELSGAEQRRAPRYSSRSLGKPEAEAGFSDSESASEEGSGSAQRPAPRHSSPSLRKSKGGQEVFAESSFVEHMSSSDEQLAPRCAPQALGESEDDPSTGSSSYVEKYNSAEDWSSSEEDLPPRCPSQALGRPKDQEEVSSVSKNAPEVSGVSVEQMPPRRPFQSWVSPKLQQQASAGPKSAAGEWDISVEPLPPRVPSKRLMRLKVEQPVSAGPEVTTSERITSVELLPSRHPSHPPTKPIAEQDISACPESTAVEGNMSRELLPPRRPSQALVRPVVEHQFSSGAESAMVEKSISMELLLPRHHSQPLMRPLAQQHVSAGPESAVAEGSISREPLPSKVLAQPLMNAKAEHNVFSDLEGVSAEQIIPVETLLPKYSPQSLTNPQAQKIFSENTAVEEGMFGELLPPRHSFQQSWVSPKFEQQASAGPESAAMEWGISVEPLPPRVPSQPLARPVVKQAISAGPESVPSTELPLAKHSWSIVRRKVRQMSSLESAAVEVGISGRPLPPRHPAQVAKKSKIQEMSSRLESSTGEEDTSKKMVLSKRPSQSFVKFMAQQIFSESPAVEEGNYVDPLFSNPPSKSMLRPKVEHQVFSGWESADTEGGSSSKLLPMKSPLEGLRRPEGSQEVFAHSESGHVKWSSSKDQQPPRHLAPALGKLEYQQEISSASERSRGEWRSSEEQLPCRRPFQAEDEAEFQPQTFSTGPVSAPAEGRGSEERLPPRHTFQALADPEYQQQVYSSSVSAAAEETISESKPSCWSLPRDPTSPNKTKKRSQSSENLIKNTPTPATKPVKFTVTPAWQASISEGTYSKEEALGSGAQNNSHSNSPTNGADVENLFGVRLRRTSSSQKGKSGKQDFTKHPSHSLGPISSSIGRGQQIRRRASTGLLGSAQSLPTASNFAERLQRRPKSESMGKKQPAYRTPGKAPGQQSDCATSEPAWITMVKQKQGSFQANIPAKEPKTKNRAGAKPETKEPRYWRAGLANENQSRRIFSSNVNRQEKMVRMKLPTSTKAGFEDDKILQVHSMKKETRRSSTLPVTLQQPVEPAEPVWFSLAKKKAKAWSQMAEIIK